MIIIISPLADQDLFGIWDYIANNSYYQADKISGDFHRVFLLFADNPEMGRRRDELKKGLRSYPLGRYVIFYKSTPKEIQIVRVLHGSRDDASIFDG